MHYGTYSNGLTHTTNSRLCATQLTFQLLHCERRGDGAFYARLFSQSILFHFAYKKIDQMLGALLAFGG